MSPGTLGQFLLYSVFAAGALGALSEVWGELSQAAGAAERLTELLAEARDQGPSQSATASQTRKGARLNFATSSSAIRPVRIAALHGLNFAVKPGET
jgi:ATP-binding cassette subfamily B protein